MSKLKNKLCIKLKIILLLKLLLLLDFLERLLIQLLL